MTKLINFGVKVPILGVLEFKGCFVAQIEGYALSCHDSADFYCIALLGPNGSVGPLIEHGAPGSDERMYYEALKADAESSETTWRLEEAWSEYDDGVRESLQCDADDRSPIEARVYPLRG